MIDSQHIYDVFKTVGVPTITYVTREAGAYEQALTRGIHRGTICLVTGGSKTGKTSLITKALASLGLTPEVLRGNHKTNDIVEEALQSSGTKRIKNITYTRSGNATVGGEIAGGNGLWSSIVGLSLKIRGEIARAQGESVNVEPVGNGLRVEDMIRNFTSTNRFLVIEDLQHYPLEEQQRFAKECKAFVDTGFPIIIISTDPHAHELIDANFHLQGRVSEIKVTPWLVPDLQEIARKGFQHLGIPLPDPYMTLIAEESIGLPIIMQQICLRLAEKYYDASTVCHPHVLTIMDVYTAMQDTAIHDYNFERLMKQLAELHSGWSSLFQVINTEPLSTAFTLRNIHERANDEPKVDTTALSETFFRGITTTRQHGVFYEWVKRKQTLHIIEPTLLFYLRWHDPDRRISPIIREGLNTLKILGDSRLRRER